LLEGVRIEADGIFILKGNDVFDWSFSNIDLSASTLTIKGTAVIATEATEDLNLVPGAGGITVIGEGSPTYLSSPTKDDAFIAGRAEIAGAAHINGIHIRELSGAASMLIAENSNPASSTGDNCVFVGYVSGASHTSGHANICVGGYTGEDLTTGNYNTCIGHTAGKDIIDGANNTLLGYLVGIALTSGGNNIAIGAEVLGGTTSNNNIVLGYRSARNMVSASGNILMGYDVGEALTTENYNVCIGRQSAKNLTGANNVFLGTRVGRDVTTGSSNIFLGHEAGMLLTNVSNTLLVGNSSTSNLIYGKFDTGDVGIGTIDLDGTPPKGRLTLKGSTNDGTTNVLVLRDSDEANILSVDTNGVFEFTSYTRHHDILPNAASLGPTAPDTVIQDTFVGLGFDADAETALITVEVPPEWTGASDMCLNVIWMAESGDAVADTETVKWDVSYRSVAEGENTDNGTVVTATQTHTQSGAGGDKELYKTCITIPYTGGNQPLAANDTLGIQFDRDVSGDTYSGEAIVVRWELEYNANKLGTH